MVLSSLERCPKTASVEGLHDGDHACLTYADDEVLWQALTVYTWVGLVDGQRVLIVLDPDDLRDDEAVARMDSGGRVDAAWAAGQLELQRSTSFYFPDGTLDKERQLAAYASEIARAHRAGWSGLRGAGSVNWAPGRGWGATEVADFESSVGVVFADGNFTAICWYDQRRCNDFLVAAAREVHPMQIMSRLDALDVAAVPDREPAATPVAVGASNQLTPSLATALDGLLDRGLSRFELDLTDLSFMETDGAIQLINFADSLTEGGRVTVRCGPVLALVLRGLGSDRVAQLDIITE
jgi:hypothetical protein